MAGNINTDLVPRIHAWITDEWMPGHKTWTLEWKAGSNLAISRVQPVHYDDEFAALPPPQSSPHGHPGLQIVRSSAPAPICMWLCATVFPDSQRNPRSANRELVVFHDD